MTHLSKTTLVALLSVSLFSCAGQEPPTIKEQQCSTQRKVARAELKQGSLIYCMDVPLRVRSAKSLRDPTSYPDGFRHEKEFLELLEEHDIAFRDIAKNPLEPGGQCYKACMDSALVRQKGWGFIDSLHKRADSLYCNKPDTFLYPDRSVDKLPSFPGDNFTKAQWDNFNAFRNKNVRWPKGFNPEDADKLYVDVSLVVEITGKIHSVEYYYATGRPRYKDVIEHFKKEAIRLINKSPDWVPGEIGGRKVRTALKMRISFAQTS